MCLIFSLIIFCLSSAFNVLRQLFLEAKEKDYPDNNLFRSLQRAVKDAEKYVGLGKEMEYTLYSDICL